MKRCFQHMAIMVTALLVTVAAPFARAQNIDVEKAARIKAAYLLNFVRYTQWPQDAFEQPDSPIVLTEVGTCDAEAVLAEVVRRSEPINGRRLELRNAAYPDDELSRRQFYQLLEQSHLIYVCSAGVESLSAMLEHIGSTKVLTVGDTPDFAGSGGMLGFVLRQNRIVFEANPKAIQKSQVAMSAKVLKLAQIVETGEPQ